MLLDQVTLPLRPGRFGRQKHHADAKRFGQAQPGLTGDMAQKRLRQIEQQAAAVTSLAVGRYRATVGQAHQRLDGIGDGVVIGLAVEPGNQPETAGIFLEIRVMQLFQGEVGSVGYVSVWPSIPQLAGAAARIGPAGG